jgi:putative transposase
MAEPETVGSEVGPDTPHHQPGVAPELGAHHPVFAFSHEIRKVIYTTNAVESLNMSLRKIIKTRRSFHNEEAARRLLYLALRNHSKKWTFVQSWREALNRFQILWPQRMPTLERS